MKRESGFTMVELMIVIGVSAIIVMFAVPGVLDKLNCPRRRSTLLKSLERKSKPSVISGAICKSSVTNQTHNLIT